MCYFRWDSPHPPRPLPDALRGWRPCGGRALWPLPPTQSFSGSLAILSFCLRDGHSFLRRSPPRHWAHPPRLLLGPCLLSSMLFLSLFLFNLQIWPDLPHLKKSKRSIFWRIPFKLFFHFFIMAKTHEHILHSCYIPALALLWPPSCSLLASVQCIPPANMTLFPRVPLGTPDWRVRWPIWTSSHQWLCPLWHSWPEFHSLIIRMTLFLLSILNPCLHTNESLENRRRRGGGGGKKKQTQRWSRMIPWSTYVHSFTKMASWGIWVAQMVKQLTLGFSPGHDLKVVRWSPVSVSTLSRELLGILSLCPSPCSQGGSLNL